MSKAHKAKPPEAPESPESPVEPRAVAETTPPAPEPPLEARAAALLADVKALQADEKTACTELSRALGHLDYARHWLGLRRKRLDGPKPAGPVWG